MRQLVCPGCGATNRAPEEKNAAAAKCGRCGEVLFRGQPLDVSSAQLQTHLRASQGVALLLDVWAPWCGPCRMMAPHFAAAAGQLEPGVRLLKLNSEAEPQAAADLGVSGIPALLLFRDGRVIARQAGAMSANQIVAWATQALARAAA
jgi:thioredoxin 2